MADPTIQRVLDAIAALEVNLSGRIDGVDSKMADVASTFDSKMNHVTSTLDSKMADVASTLDSKIDDVAITLGAKIDDAAITLGARIGIVDSKLDAHRLETAKGFADLDRELARHADPVHRKLEDEMAALRKLVTTKKSSRRGVVRRPRQG